MNKLSQRNKILLSVGILVLIVLSGCTTNNEWIQCEKTEGEFCIQEYNPVCGDDKQTYSNSCVACKQVNKYKRGECSGKKM